MDYKQVVFGLAAMLCAALIAFATTPAVRVFAHKLKAIDIPTDNRRMHKKPIPRLGGLAIYLGFTLTMLFFIESFSPTVIALLVGGSVIVLLGMLDDIFRLKATVKLVVQIGVAFIAVWQDITVERIFFMGSEIEFGAWAIPITVFWIVGLTNAINLIDGLDGLSCGVSAISAASLLLVSILMGESHASTLLMAILVGACVGFLPFNLNPARIFMGDTGALFLGYSLSVISIEGVLKMHTLVSFIIPILIFAFPLFDTAFAFTRRIIHGKSPFSPDRGHLHHRLIDMGLNQKQTVAILYSVCALLGLSAIMFTSERLWRAGALIILAVFLLLLNFRLFKNPVTREQSGIVDSIEEEKKDETKEEK